MRKLLWGGVAMLILGATSVYIAADHAAKHPNSFLGRCATGAVSFALTGNPVIALQQLQHSEGLPEDLIQGPGDPAEVAKPELPPIEDFEVIETEEPQQEVPEPVHVIQIPQTCTMPEGDAYPCPPAPSNESNFEEYSDFVMDPSIEQLPVMPEVVDDETSEPATEGGAIDRGEFGEDLVIPVKRTRIINSGGIYQGTVEWTEDPVSPDRCEKNEQNEMPGCNWLIRLLGLEKMLEPTPEPMTEIEPMPSSEEVKEEMPTRDPNYHRYHYQGCPYSGCPYPHSSSVPYTPGVETPPVPEENDTTPLPKKIKKIKKIKKTNSFWQIFSGMEESSCPPSVDTMECRPTDVPPMDLPRFRPF